MPRETDKFRFERELFAAGLTCVAGVDEAGRGPLAGPVVVAAVAFPRQLVADGLPDQLHGLNDSKQVSARNRERFFQILTTTARIEFSIQIVDATTIDRLNILGATHLGMREALSGLAVRPDHALVDGLPVPWLGFPQTALVKGDSRSYSIAAASILAKVTRDRLMVDFDRRYPGYGFAQHKGYPTAAHFEALQRLGACAIHRRSFAPVALRQAELF